MAVPIILYGAAALVAAYGPNIYNGLKDIAEIQWQEEPHAPTSAGLRNSFNAEAFAEDVLVTKLPPELQKDFSADINALSINDFKEKYGDHLAEASITIKARPAMFDMRDAIPLQGIAEIATDLYAADTKPPLTHAINSGSDHTYSVYGFQGREGIVLEAHPTSADTGRMTSTVVNNLMSDNKLKMYPPSLEPVAGRGSVVWNWNSDEQINVGPSEKMDAIDAALQYNRMMEVGVDINKQNLDYVATGDDALNSNSVTNTGTIARGSQIPAEISSGIELDGKHNTVPGLNKKIDVGAVSAIDPAQNTISDLFNSIQRNEQGLWQTLKEEPSAAPIPAPAPAPFN